MKYEFDIDFLAEHYAVSVNDEKYSGKIVVGDILTVNSIDYSILGMNEDAIVVKELK